MLDDHGMQAHNRSVHALSLLDVEAPAHPFENMNFNHFKIVGRGREGAP